MKIAYNVSTINYLWQAESLAQSFIKHNPDYTFFVCIIDRVTPDLDITKYKFSFNIIWIDELQTPTWDKMVEHYTLFELVMSTKALVLDYLFKNFNPNFALCLDSDMIIFDSFQLIENQLDKYNIYLTPYCYSPIPITTPIELVENGFSDTQPLEDRMMLYVGIYNMGFIAVKNTPETESFVKWWVNMSINQCFVGRKQGMFGEQLCINLVPIYFEKVLVIKDLGYNAASWNFHERSFSEKDGKFYVNDEFPLVFYHYSGYSADYPDRITRWTPLTFDNKPDVKPIFKPYYEASTLDKYPELRNKISYFLEIKKQILERKKVVVIESLQYRILRRLLMYVPKSIREDLQKILIP